MNSLTALGHFGRPRPKDLAAALADALVTSRAKRHCAAYGKTFVALRTASIACFLAAMTDMTKAVPAD